MDNPRNDGFLSATPADKILLRPDAASIDAQGLLSSGGDKFMVNSRNAPMRVVYLCHDFGQPDHDRCAALATSGVTLRTIVWARADSVYRWQETQKSWNSHSSIPVGSPALSVQISALVQFISALVAFRPDVLIVYGYNNPAFFICAAVFSLSGTVVVTMNDSRFSDYRRTGWKDVVKGLMLLPYRGCLAASAAAADYAWFLGLRRLAVYHCAVDVSRISEGARASYKTTPYVDRAFLIVSRFEEKKNLPRILDAYALYLAHAAQPRRLNLIGYGPMEAEIRARVDASPLLKQHVDVIGFVTASQVPTHMGSALCLILASLCDQFGIVVTEALASGIPVIVSSNCGAAELVQPWKNGFIIEPAQTESIARAMIEMDGSEADWNQFSDNARQSASAADVDVFVEGLKTLVPVHAIVA